MNLQFYFFVVQTFVLGYTLPAKTDLNDLIQDFDRIKFHKDYIAALLRAIR